MALSAPCWDLRQCGLLKEELGVLILEVRALEFREQGSKAPSSREQASLGIGRVLDWES